MRSSPIKSTHTIGKHSIIQEMPYSSDNGFEVEQRRTPRPNWLVRQAAFVSKNGVFRSTLIFSAIAIAGSTILCHIIYQIFGVPQAAIALILPTLAPAVIAPPMIYILIRAVDLLGQAESGLKAQRERLQEAVKLSQDQARKADAAAHAKSDFLAHMSHELRTPLNAILGFSETIRDTRLGPIGTESYREYAGYIHDSGEHLLSLINDILDMSRIEAGQRELHVELHQAIDLVRESLALIEGEANSKKITLDISEVAPGLTVRGDRRAIKQVLINLLSNAVKFTPKGGHVKILGEFIGNEATEFTVTDTGTGIPEESLEQIFESFVRLGEAEAGTGLGLPLVKGLVNLHGGSLTIDSAPAVGTKVHVKFPMVTPLP